MANPVLRAGDPAPDLSLSDDAGNTVRLHALHGNPVVLYFYPKDATPGCTREACDFRDLHAELLALGVRLFGVSPDSVRSHGGFRERYGLPFPLLVDADHEVAARFGAWRSRVRYGKESVGMVRSTFLIDRDGRIARVWDSVKVDGHADAVLEAARALDRG